MGGYSNFASCYDKLTQNVNYSKRADYICKIFKKLNHDPGLCLDLACGTGTLTIELAKKGIDVFGLDSSTEMLSKAQQKASEQGLEILFLCQKMQKLNLYGTVDTVVCALDSINHLTKEEDVVKTFKRVALFLNQDAYFIFDMNTIYKHEKILANNTFVYDLDDVFCVWQNTFYNQTNKVKINLDLFEYEQGAYYRSSEEFCECAYSKDKTIGMLNEAGLEVIHIFNDMSFEEPKETSERIIFVTRKV